MATIKQLLGAEKSERLYSLKDKLKGEQILDSDPMRLNRTLFTKYMAAKAEAMILDYTNEGVAIDEAFRKTEMFLTIVDAKWREEAKNINTVTAGDMVSS